MPPSMWARHVSRIFTAVLAPVDGARYPRCPPRYYLFTRRKGDVSKEMEKIRSISSPLPRGCGVANVPPYTGCLGQELIVLRAVHSLHLPHIRLQKKKKTVGKIQTSRWEDPKESLLIGTSFRCWVSVAALEQHPLGYITIPGKNPLGYPAHRV